MVESTCMATAVLGKLLLYTTVEHDLETKSALTAYLYIVYKTQKLWTFLLCSVTMEGI